MCEWTALLVVAAVVAIAWCAWRAWHGAPPAPYAPPLAGVAHTATVLGARYDSDKSDALMLVLEGAFVPVALGCRATPRAQEASAHPIRHELELLVHRRIPVQSFSVPDRGGRRMGHPCSGPMGRVRSRSRRSARQVSFDVAEGGEHHVANHLQAARAQLVERVVWRVPVGIIQ